ncbi:TIGR01621 family pseudouridine synthase [Colwellia sp. E2M01]|uniref:TIGR01621 family pseudouridine synthase n=1 Tax=Colwellia sp. E2M01 TaxID=2841561 RepID=UPI001C0985C0|nr:TIGR01621 family pseudouridine synthase [Colwellia sp. E2M01]MBU2871816.1 TIGR01621 family pseudouridine synthase [Colwellia sp. E2M01]
MFKVITQHPDFIVVNKEAGINFHDEGELGSGLHSRVKNYLAQEQSNLQTKANNSEENTELVPELYPVHRLDKMTSGIVIFAKNLAAAQTFGQLFSEHKIEKYYLAISDKKPTKKQGLIKGDMVKSRRGMFKLLRTVENPAITQFFSYVLPSEKANKQRLYLLKPHSGKTHQLRVALASIGAPIVGDPLYYPQPDVKTPIDRGYLHAYALKFTYLGDDFEFTCLPTAGENYLAIQANGDFIEPLTAIKSPWLLNWPKF